MTSRDFRLIASALAETSKHNAVDLTFAEGWHAAVSAAGIHLADALALTNPRFDRDRFLAAATGEPTTPGDRPRSRDYGRRAAALAIGQDLDNDTR